MEAFACRATVWQRTGQRRRFAYRSHRAEKLRQTRDGVVPRRGARPNPALGQCYPRVGLLRSFMMALRLPFDAMSSDMKRKRGTQK